MCAGQNEDNRFFKTKITLHKTGLRRVPCCHAMPAADGVAVNAEGAAKGTAESVAEGAADGAANGAAGGAADGTADGVGWQTVPATPMLLREAE